MLRRACGRAVDLILVRHGQTSWNATGRFQGHSDIPLCENGRWQAEALARALADEAIDAAYSSDLSRAVVTARVALASHRVDLRLDARLREFNFGRWEGLTWGEIAARGPGGHVSGRTDAREYEPEGGENFTQVCSRVAAFLANLRASTAKRVLIVSHAGALHALFAEVLGKRFDGLDLRFDHASISRLTCEGSGVQIKSLNDISHLDSSNAR